MGRFVSLSALLASFILAGCAGPTEQLSAVGSTTLLSADRSFADAHPDAYYYIYVLQSGSETVGKYYRNCKKITEFTTGTVDPEGIALDHTGKVYVANGEDNSVTTYVDKEPSTPLITSGLNDPLAVAIGKQGVIFVANYTSNTITTYNSDGTRRKLTITKGIDGPQGVYVDNNGKIYVTNGLNNTLTTYTSNGAQTAPTIEYLDDPYGVVATKHYIYVTNRNANSISVFASDGSMDKTYMGMDEPEGLALAGAGALIVANYGNGSLWGTGFCRGLQGLDGPSGVALEPYKN